MATDSVLFSGKNPDSSKPKSPLGWMIPVSLLAALGIFGPRACQTDAPVAPRFAPISTPVDAIDSALVYKPEWRWLDDFSRFWADAEGLGYNNRRSDKSLMGITGKVPIGNNKVDYWSPDHRQFHMEMQQLYPAYTSPEGIKAAPKEVKEKAFRLLERFMYNKAKDLKLDTLRDDNLKFLLLEINSQIGSGFTERLLVDMDKRNVTLTTDNLLQEVWRYRNGSHSPSFYKANKRDTDYDFLSLGDGRLRRNLMRWAEMEERGEDMTPLTTEPRQLKALRQDMNRLRKNDETLTQAMERITGTDSTLFALLNNGKISADTLKWFDARHVRQKDETLESIATRYGVTVEDLNKANSTRTLNEGQLVRIPITGTQAKAFPKRWYHIWSSPGSQSLKDIASERGIPKSVILKLNPGLNYRDDLDEGTTVVLPKRKSSPKKKSVQGKVSQSSFLPKASTKLLADAGNHKKPASQSRGRQSAQLSGKVAKGTHQKR